MTWAAVLLGGAVGAVARFGVNWLAARASRPPPWATFTVNVVGSLVLGLLAGVGTALPGWVGALVGTGFCGALTTYSTFGYETVQLAGSGPAGRGRALLNVVATLTVGLGVAALGWYLGSRL
ncbi:fluoride efflux transporter FluC [Plantactinospora soyae]|uniref:fluoride efflux transporter FluC n=1 Tax=Plantactinospora soyae TaxID=1544732 RepID=UPI001789FE55|nr:CrcB family protein [Plantactinospora soyae]